MQLSVVLICWNSLNYLREALASLQETLTASTESEIIIIDNGSTDGTDTFIATHYPQVTYRRLPENRGVAYARNRGIELAQGQYVWLLDDDTIANSEALNEMLQYMHTHPQCGICGCRLLNANGETQESYKPYPSLAIKVRNVLQSRLGGNTPADYYAREIALGTPFEPTYIIGACQLIRREVIVQIGLLDEKIFYGPEDADYCIRARKAGWHTAYLPQVGIVHHWKRITNRSPFSRIGRKHTAALIYFYCKHRKL
ncbi:MAG: glycosyltransferase family 2 protein [Bacteroidales bacterium]|nr:glycosyltransferase family 2 protein [Bacteroidales bacterium]